MKYQLHCMGWALRAYGGHLYPKASALFTAEPWQEMIGHIQAYIAIIIVWIACRPGVSSGQWGLHACRPGAFLPMGIACRRVFFFPGLGGLHAGQVFFPLAYIYMRLYAGWVLFLAYGDCMQAGCFFWPMGIVCRVFFMGLTFS